MSPQPVATVIDVGVVQFVPPTVMTNKQPVTVGPLSALGAARALRITHARETLPITGKRLADVVIRVSQDDGKTWAFYADLGIQGGTEVFSKTLSRDFMSRFEPLPTPCLFLMEIQPLADFPLDGMSFVIE